MIDALLFGALGFLLGCLLALALAPPLWKRAVKLTTRRLEATMPMTLNDIQADKDQQRAAFAIELRKVEVALDKAREKAARELIEATSSGNLDGALASVPPGARETVSDAAGQGLISGLNEIFMLGGILSLAAALVALWLVRERDIEREAPIELPEARAVVEREPVPEPVAA